MFHGIFRKADVLLLVALILIGLASSLAIAGSRTAGSRVEILQDGKLYGSYTLMTDRTIRIERGDEYNIVKIRNGAVSVTEASCKNQICVEHASIRHSGESIACLPHRLSIHITGKGGSYDAIA